MATRRVSSEPRKCQVEGCERPHKALGYCLKHYARHIRTGSVVDPIKPPPLCCVPGCGAPHSAKGYCNRHYQHLYHFGRIKSRTTTDPNIFTIDGDICRISLFNRDGETVNEAIIDAVDYDLVKDRKWYFRPSRDNGYVVSGYRKTEIRLHRFLMNASLDDIVDHIDRDTLNNRKSNLRICTCSQNAQNTKTVGRPNKSGVKNVHWSAGQKKWCVEVQSQGERYRIGSFKNIEDAKKAAHDARDKYHGQYACHS